MNFSNSCEHSLDSLIPRSSRNSFIYLNDLPRSCRLINPDTGHSRLWFTVEVFGLVWLHMVHIWSAENNLFQYCDHYLCVLTLSPAFCVAFSEEESKELVQNTYLDISCLTFTKLMKSTSGKWEMSCLSSLTTGISLLAFRQFLQLDLH